MRRETMSERREGEVWATKGSNGDYYYFGRLNGRTRRISSAVYLTVADGGEAPLKDVLWAWSAIGSGAEGDERERAIAILKGGTGERVTVRPNLNTPADPQTSVHKGTLGRKVDSKRSVSIILTGSVIRRSGEETLRRSGEKSVYAGLRGYRVPLVPIPEGARRVQYNPHKGDRDFHIDGGPLPLGSIVTSDGWRYYIARPPEGRSKPLEVVLGGFLDTIAA